MLWGFVLGFLLYLDYWRLTGPIIVMATARSEVGGAEIRRGPRGRNRDAFGDGKSLRWLDELRWFAATP